MRIDVFKKRLTTFETATRCYTMAAIELQTIVEGIDMFEFNQRTSPHLINEVNQQSSKEEVIERLRDVLNKVINTQEIVTSIGMKVNELAFKDTHAPQTWSRAVFTEIKRSSEVQMEKMNFDSNNLSDNIKYLNQLNYVPSAEFKAKLERLDNNKKYVIIEELSESIFGNDNIPEQWKWGHANKMLVLSEMLSQNELSSP